jgi:prolipoprotein diacylglyceryltransferase
MPDPTGEQGPETRRLGPWGWFAIIALMALLAAAIWYCIHAWREVAGSGISPAGWLFLILGVVFTILVGGGLMVLLFYSSRKGKDF